MEVRCQNPKCRKLFAERLEGKLWITCSRCGLRQHLVVDKPEAQGVYVATNSATS